MKFLKKLDNQGTSLIEYALIGTLIMVAAVGAIRMYTGSMNDKFQFIKNSVMGII